MIAHLRANLWLLALTVVLCCILYPLTLWGIGQTVFRWQSQGSLVDARSAKGPRTPSFATSGSKRARRRRQSRAPWPTWPTRAPRRFW